MLALLLPAALAFDSTHVRLQRVLDARLAAGRVDYAGLKSAPAELDAYLTEVATAEPAGMSADDRKAFWINAYNALTIDLIADSYPLKSITDLDGGKVWDTRKFPVAGTSMTLNDIEQRTLRPLGDPRVHAALNCASIGCPGLAAKVYTGAGLSGQLDAASKRWVASAKLEGASLSVSQIFDWYGDDFLGQYGPSRFDIPGLDGKAEAAANFVAMYAPDKATALHAGGYKVGYAPYDWGLNKR